MAYRQAILLGNVNSLQLSIRFSEVSNHLKERHTQAVALRFGFWLVSTLHLLAAALLRRQPFRSFI